MPRRGKAADRKLKPVTVEVMGMKRSFRTREEARTYVENVWGAGGSSVEDIVEKVKRRTGAEVRIDHLPSSPKRLPRENVTTTFEGKFVSSRVFGTVEAARAYVQMWIQAGSSHRTSGSSDRMTDKNTLEVDTEKGLARLRSSGPMLDLIDGDIGGYELNSSEKFDLRHCQVPMEDLVKKETNGQQGPRAPAATKTSKVLLMTEGAVTAQALGEELDISPRQIRIVLRRNKVAKPYIWKDPELKRIRAMFKE